jgi:hypothetical protein
MQAFTHFISHLTEVEQISFFEQPQAILPRNTIMVFHF